MDWNPLLNKVIRSRDAMMAVEDPLMDLLAAMCKQLVKLEAATTSAEALPTLTKTPWWTPGRQALVAHLPVETIQALEEWLTERLATVPAPSDSSPSTIGPMEKLTGSPGASHVSTQEPTTGRDTSESSRLAQSGMAGVSLEEAGDHYLRATNESWRRFYSSIRRLMSQLPTPSGESPVGPSGAVRPECECPCHAGWWKGSLEHQAECWCHGGEADG